MSEEPEVEAGGETAHVHGGHAPDDTPMRPLVSSTRAMSVKVPPISTPIRQAMFSLSVEELM